MPLHPSQGMDSMEDMTIRKNVVLVDDDITTLSTGKNFLADMYALYTVPSGKALFKLLDHVGPDLILLDVEMPEMNGYEVIKILKADAKTADIPVIFLTARSDAASELEGLLLGAVDYIAKPFSLPLLRKRVELHLLMGVQRRQLEEYNSNLQQAVEKKAGTVIELQDVVVDLLAFVVEYRDDATGGHINRTRRYIDVMMKELVRRGIYRDEILGWDQRLVVLSSALHDVGKLAIPDSILLKPGPLNEEELRVMRKHPGYGGEIIGRVENNTSARAFIEHAKLMATTHHEKWDGSGYPLGLAGIGIPLQGRLMALADVYDALVSERPYKLPVSHEKAREIISKGSGRAFEPVLVNVFLHVADRLSEASMHEYR
jgi:putative two-component system response regulator